MSRISITGPRHSSSSSISSPELREARRPMAEAPRFRGPSDGFFEGPTRSHRSHRHPGLSHPSEGMGGKGGATDPEALQQKIAELTQMLQDVLAKLGQANGQSPDSTNGANGADGANGTNGASDTQFQNAAKTLQDNFDLVETAAGIGGKDGKLGKQDLKAIQNNPDAPQALKDACKYFLDNPEAFKKLVGAGGQGGGDGLVRLEDLAAAASGGAGPVDETPPSEPSTPPKPDTSTHAS